MFDFSCLQHRAFETQHAENFVEWVFFLVDEGRVWIQIPLKVGHQRADDGQTLNADLVAL